MLHTHVIGYVHCESYAESNVCAPFCNAGDMERLLFAWLQIFHLWPQWQLFSPVVAIAYTIDCTDQFEYSYPPSRTDHIELWCTSLVWWVSHVSIAELLKFIVLDVCLQMLTSLLVSVTVTSTSCVSSAGSIFVSFSFQSLEIGNLLLFEGDNSWTWQVKEELSLVLFLPSLLEELPRRRLSVPEVWPSVKGSKKGLSVSLYVLSFCFCRKMKTAGN